MAQNLVPHVETVGQSIDFLNATVLEMRRSRTVLETPTRLLTTEAVRSSRMAFHRIHAPEVRVHVPMQHTFGGAAR